MERHHHGHRGDHQPNATKSLSVSSSSESDGSSSDGSLSSDSSRDHSPRRNRNERDAPRTMECPTCHGSGKIPTPHSGWNSCQYPPMNFDFCGYAGPGCDYRSYYPPQYPPFNYPYPPPSFPGMDYGFGGGGHWGRGGHHKRRHFNRGGHCSGGKNHCDQDSDARRHSERKDRHTSEDNKEDTHDHHPHHPHPHGFPFPPPPPPPPPAGFYQPGQVPPFPPHGHGPRPQFPPFFDPKYWKDQGIDLNSISSMFGDMCGKKKGRCGKKCGGEKECKSSGDHHHDDHNDHEDHDEQGSGKPGDIPPPHTNLHEDVD